MDLHEMYECHRIKELEEENKLLRENFKLRDQCEAEDGIRISRIIEELKKLWCCF